MVSPIFSPSYALLVLPGSEEEASLQAIERDPSLFLKLTPEEQRNPVIIAKMLVHREIHIPSLDAIIQQDPSYHSLLPGEFLQTHPLLLQAAFRNHTPQQLIVKCSNNLAIIKECMRQDPELIKQLGPIIMGDVLHNLRVNNPPLYMKCVEALASYHADGWNTNYQAKEFKKCAHYLTRFYTNGFTDHKIQFIKQCIMTLGVPETLKRLQYNRDFIDNPQEAALYLKPKRVRYIRSMEMFTPDTLTVTHCLHHLLKNVIEQRAPKDPYIAHYLIADETNLFRVFIFHFSARELYELVPTYIPAVQFAISCEPTLFIELLDKGSSLCEHQTIVSTFLFRLPPQKAAIRFPQYQAFFEQYQLPQKKLGTVPLKWDKTLTGAPHVLKWFA